MRYTVEFEMQSGLTEAVGEAVYKALVSAFGSVAKLKVAPIPEYVGYVQENQSFLWHEVPHDRRL